jgi:hypothetical protein
LMVSIYMFYCYDGIFPLCLHYSVFRLVYIVDNPFCKIGRTLHTLHFFFRKKCFTYTLFDTGCFSTFSEMVNYTLCIRKKWFVGSLWN